MGDYVSWTRRGDYARFSKGGRSHSPDKYLPETKLSLGSIGLWKELSDLKVWVCRVAMDEVEVAEKLRCLVEAALSQNGFTIQPNPKRQESIDTE